MILRVLFAVVDAAIEASSAARTISRWVQKKIEQRDEAPPQPLSFKDVEWQREQMRRATKSRSDD